MLETVRETLRTHWPEYLIEAAGLGAFMVSACFFGVLLFHPASPVADAIPDAVPRRILMGIAMGLTAVALIMAPWGQRSGAHFNPATTVTYWRLGKIATADVGFYVVAQTVGGVAGVMLSSKVLGPALSHPAVDYVVTVPGPLGAAAAFLAESTITFVLMTVVLRASNTPGVSRFTPLLVGVLVATYIAVEAPISGMSMNPARTLASALGAGTWTAWWIYVTAPPLGMLLAAEVYVRSRGLAAVFCAKLHHDNGQRCIFRCRYGAMRESAPPPHVAERSWI